MTTRTTRIWRRGAVLAFGSAVLLAACGGSGGDDDLDAAPAVTVGAPAAETTVAPAATAPAPTAPATTTPPTTAAHAATGPGSAAIIATATSALGPVVVDRDGRAVYAFTHDEAGQTPACVDQCAKNWPPLLVSAAPTPAGSIDGDQLGTVARADGANQATYAGHPLYYFNGDHGPGELQGQGVGGTWYALDPAGQLVTDSANGTVNIGATGVGDVAVNDQGYTLYLFKNDTKDGAPTCVDTCAENWPPLTVEQQATAGAGIDSGLLGWVPRPDGTTQVTLNGWPLYRFAADKAPGDANGQGVGGAWYAATPEGKFSEAAAGAPAAAPAPAPAAPAPAAVAATIKDFSFKDLEVAKGTTVTWTNQDPASHTVTADDGSFDSGLATPLKQGATFSHTFTEAGTFAFHCQIHPSMQGTVTVR